MMNEVQKLFLSSPIYFIFRPQNFQQNLLHSSVFVSDKMLVPSYFHLVLMIYDLQILALILLVVL